MEPFDTTNRMRYRKGHVGGNAGKSIRFEYYLLLSLFNMAPTGKHPTIHVAFAFGGVVHGLPGVLTT